MKKHLPADYHLHTHHSGDSEAPMDKVIESAINLGLPAMCITEHMDMDFPVAPGEKPDIFEVDTDAYHAEYLEMKEKYKDKIDICFGIELGLQPHIVQQNKEFIEKYPFDFVIGSNHISHRMDPFYPGFYEGRSEKEAFAEFFESTLENITVFDDFDVLGHLDYIVRYAPNQDKNYNYEDHREILDEILKTLIKKEKGLDINTKSLYMKSPLKDANPSTAILKRFHELGGEIITFGSDAHKPEDVGKSFEQGVEIAKACGFTKYCRFKSRKPQFFDL